MRFRYMVVEVKRETMDAAGRYASNPGFPALLAGRYQPPHGWRAVSHANLENGFTILLEQEASEVPYR